MATAALELLIELKDNATAALEGMAGSLTSIGALAGGVVVGGLAAAAGAAVSFAGDAAQSVNDLQASLGLSAEEAQRLGDVATQVFGNNWGDSMQDVTQSLTDVRQQMKGLAEGELQQATQSAIAIRDVFGVEVPESTNAANALMEKFGLTSQQAFDFIAKGFQSGLNNSGDFLDTIGEYSVQFSDAGYSADEFFSTLQSGIQSGTSLGTDKIADFVKEGRIRIMEMSDDVVDAFQSIGKAGFGEQLAAQFGEVGDLVINTREKADAAAAALAKMGISVDPEKLLQPLTLVDEKTGQMTTQAQQFGDVFMSEILQGIESGTLSVADAQQLAIQGLNQMDNEVWQNTAGIKLFGTQWEDLGPTAALALDTTRTKMDDLAGATDSLNAKYNNWGALWEGFKRQALVALAPLGEQLLGLANMVMPAITAAMTTIIPIITTIVSGLITGFQSVMAALAPVGAFISANLAPILAGLGTLIIGALIPAFAGIVATATAAAPILIGLFAGWAVGAAAAAAATLAAAAPVIALGAAVALLVAAWQNNWFGIRDIVAAVWAYLEPIFTQLVTWFQAQIPVALAAVSAAFASLQPALAFVGSVITGVVLPALMQVGAWLASNIPVAIAAAVAAFQTVASVGATVWGVVVSAVQGAVAGISAAVSVIATVVQAAWNTVQFVTQAVWGAIWSYIGPPLTQAASAVASATQAILGALQSAWNQVASITSTAWATVSTAISAALSTVQGVVSGVIASVLSVLQGGWAQAQTATRGPWEQVRTIIVGVMDAIKTAIQTGITVVKTIMAGAWQVVVAAAKNDFGSIPGIISSVWEKVKAALGAGIARIKEIAGQLSDTAMALGKSLVDGIIKGAASGAGALVSKIKDMAKSALSAFQGAIQSHSPSKLFAKEGGLPIPQGIALGIEQGTPLVSGAILDLSQKMFDTIGKGSEALSKLANLAAVPTSAINAFMDGLQSVAEGFASFKEKIGKQMQATAVSYAETMGKVVDGVGKGVEVLSKLADLTVPTRDSIAAFIGALEQIVDELYLVSQRHTKVGLVAASLFATGAASIYETIGKGVDALLKLSEFVKPVPGVIQSFTDVISWLVSRFALAGHWLDSDALAAAGRFAAGAGQVGKAVAEGVDGLLKLADFVKPIPGAIQTFTDTIAWLVSRFALAGQWMGQRALAAAESFADGAGKAAGVLGAGVDGLLKLSEFVKPAPGAIQRFTDVVAWLVTRFQEAGQWIGAKGVAAAATFADGAGKIVGIIGSGVDNLLKLGSFTGITGATVDLFIESLTMFVARFVAGTRGFVTDSLSAAAEFAEGAGKITGAISNGVTGLMKLNEFTGTTGAAIDLFIESLTMFVARFSSGVAGFNEAGLKAASIFAEGAGKVLNIIGSGVDGLMKLNTFVAPAFDAANRFSQVLSQVVYLIWTAAMDNDQKAVEAAAIFATSAGKVLDIIAKGVDGLNKLSDFVAPAFDSVNRFSQVLSQVVYLIWTAATDNDAKAVEAAAVFANSAGKVVGIISTAVDAFAKLNDFVAPAFDSVNRFSQSISQVVYLIWTAATDNSVEAVEAAAVFAQGAGKVISIIGAGVDAFTKLKDMHRVAVDSVKAFSDNFVLVIGEVQKLATKISAETITAAQTFASGAAAVIKSIAEAIGSFAKLGDFQGVAKGVLDNFTAGLSALLAEVQRQVLPTATNVGANAMTGIANGIMAQLPQVVNVARTAAQAVALALQPLGAFGIPTGAFAGGQVVVNASPTVNIIFAPGAFNIQAPSNMPGQAFAEAIAYQVLVIIQNRTGMRLVG